jgi:acid stress-induced BolA-like protein IbaG/YrbA
MVLTETLQKMLLDAFPGAIVEVQSADQVHFDAYICARQFKGLSRVAQQKSVYAVLGELISQGTVHALSLKTEILE